MTDHARHNGWSRKAWVCACLCTALSAAACASRTPHTVVPDQLASSGTPILGIAVDLSGSTRTLESGERQNVNALVEWATSHKAEVVLTAIGTTSAAHSAPLVDVDFDVSDGGNRFTRSRLQKPLKTEFDRALAQAFARPRGGSDIMGAIVAQAQGLSSSGGTRPKILAVVSDGWNFSDDRTLRFTKATLLQSPQTLVRRAKYDGLIPDLSGITAIYFGGGGQASTNAHPTSEVEDVRAFWLAYFAAAKGPAPQYAPVLSLPHK